MTAPFGVTILGSNSAMPVQGRHPSAQIVTYDYSEVLLVDCGEGTQFRMQEFGIRRGRIDHIFISHLHGDHVFGLVPLLTTYQLGGRVNPLQIYGPSHLEQFIYDQLGVTNRDLGYEIEVTEFQHLGLKQIAEVGGLIIKAFPLRHGVPTYGYLFEEKAKPPNIPSEWIQLYQLTVNQIKTLKSGGYCKISNDVTLGIPPYELKMNTARSYVYASDTEFDLDIWKGFQKINLLYHESTFLHSDDQRAKETNHSTAKQAAIVAHQLHCDQLIIGHISSRYSEVDQVVLEAKQNFAQTEYAKEGVTFLISN